jgi:hypothetical protein
MFIYGVFVSSRGDRAVGSGGFLSFPLLLLVLRKQLLYAFLSLSFVQYDAL